MTGLGLGADGGIYGVTGYSVAKVTIWQQVSETASK